MVLYLRDNLSVIGIGLEAIGDKTSCSVYLRRIINRAIAINAAQIVTSHNHPLGSTKPSSIDIYNEKKLRTLAIQKGINHAEHLIISPKKRYYFSFIEAGLF